RRRSRPPREARRGGAALRARAFLARAYDGRLRAPLRQRRTEPRRHRLVLVLSPGPSGMLFAQVTAPATAPTVPPAGEVRGAPPPPPPAAPQAPPAPAAPPTAPQGATAPTAPTPAADPRTTRASGELVPGQVRDPQDTRTTRDESFDPNAPQGAAQRT